MRGTVRMRNGTMCGDGGGRVLVRLRPHKAKIYMKLCVCVYVSLCVCAHSTGLHHLNVMCFEWLFNSSICVRSFLPSNRLFSIHDDSAHNRIKSFKSAQNPAKTQKRQIRNGTKHMRTSVNMIEPMQFQQYSPCFHSQINNEFRIMWIYSYGDYFICFRTSKTIESISLIKSILFE